MKYGFDTTILVIRKNQLKSRNLNSQISNLKPQISNLNSQI